ncbi:hypothetical protein J4Q44_G00145050 [Coregonus suidteri]|uniref:Uncharacterized protein n=1 Tax=Coregonus suidteri TaxID=861788 RepID=A0AAN8QX46_9TELE
MTSHGVVALQKITTFNSAFLVALVFLEEINLRFDPLQTSLDWIPSPPETDNNNHTFSPSGMKYATAVRRAHTF